MASPILTRIYTPEDFALLAVYAALLASISPLICGKYESAIVISRSTTQSKHICGLALQIAFSISITILLLLLFWGDSLLRLLDAGSLDGFIFLIPVTLLATGIMLAFTYLANREANYKLIARVKVSSAIFGVSISVFLGLFGLSYGLILGSCAASLIVCSQLLVHYRPVYSNSFLSWSKRKRVILRKYRSLPIYNATSGLLDGVTLALPIFVLSKYYPESVVGYYALVVRVASAPLSFIASSVSQVHLKKIVELLKADIKPGVYLARITVLLFLISSPLVFCFFFFGSHIFAYVFGPEWDVAGHYLEILAPALGLRFVVSTLSTTFSATGRNGLAAFWKAFAFCSTSAVLFIFAPSVSIEEILIIMLILDLVLYGLYYCFVIWAAYLPLGYK